MAILENGGGKNILIKYFDTKQENKDTNLFCILCISRFTNSGHVILDTPYR